MRIGFHGLDQALGFLLRRRADGWPHFPGRGKPQRVELDLPERAGVHERALLDFMDAPDTYLNGVLEMARTHTELIHLLRLQDRFPKASLASIIGAASCGALASAMG